MGALRRPQLETEQEQVPGHQPEAAPPLKSAYPRWAVVSGLLVYCAVFWVLVVSVGWWGIELIRTASAGPN